MIKKLSFWLSKLQSSMGELNDKKAMNNECELQNNKSVNNYGCLLKRMLYCPGSGQELLSALGVTLVCHASNVFLVLKVPLSIIDRFSKSMMWLLDQAWLAILERLVAVFVFLKFSHFSGIKKLCWFLQCNTTNNFYREFYTQHWSAIISKVGISELGTVVVEW